METDLKAAGIKKTTPKGKLDFHAIRTFFISRTIEAGATVKEAQKLARHSDPRITMNTYARARDEGLASVVDRVANSILPDGLGANMVHGEVLDVTTENANPLVSKRVSESKTEWRRGESNPHLRDATAP